MTHTSQPPTAPAPPEHPPWSLDDLLARSFELASFLHPGSEAPVEITAAVLAKLRVAALAQRKRRSYLPALRRTRLTLGECHLAQRLVLIESEPFERQTEDDPEQPPDEAEMVIRYLKHLVRIAWKRSSLYAVVATARLLCRYSTEEAARLYGVLCQDSERLPDDDYLRSRKKVLMAEVRSRFDGAVEVVQEKRGEQRLRPMDDATPYLPIVEEALERLTPWATPCPVPPRFDPFLTHLPALAERGGAAAPDTEVEIRRLHAVHHPACFEALTTALGMLRPREMLALPAFRRVGSGGGRCRRARLPNADEKRRVHRLLEAERQRQRQRSCYLQVAIDGRQVARLDRGRLATFEVGLDDGTEGVEVRAEESGALLAWCPLSQTPAEGFPRTSRLAGGGRLTFDVEVGRLRILHHPGLLQVLARRLPLRLPSLPRMRLLGAAAALLAVVIGLTIRQEVPSVIPEPAPSTRPVPSPGPVPEAGPSPSAAPPGPVAPAPAPVGGAPVSGGEVEPSRGFSPGPRRAALATVRTLYIEPLGEGEAGEALRAAVAAELAARQVFALAGDRGAADAVLKRFPRAGAGPTIGLVDRAGEVLWEVEAAPAAASPEELARLWAAALTAARAAAGEPGGG